MSYVFFYKEGVSDLISNEKAMNDAGPLMEVLLGMAIAECEVYEEAGLTPIIGISPLVEPPVVVTSKENMEGIFIQ